MPSPPLIELDRIAKSYDGGRSRVLDDVSLRIEAGSFVALVGASGAGKTTAMKMINRLSEPDHGEVRFEGTPVATLDGPVLRRRIGYVFQGVGLFPHMRVGDNIGITPAAARLAARRTSRPGSTNCSTWCGCRAASRPAFRMSCPAASASASASPGRSRRGRGSC